MNDDPHIDELASFRRAQRRHRLKLALIALSLLSVLALAPMLFGLGPLAWRLFKYDQVAVYFANVTGHDVTVEIGNRSQVFHSGDVHVMTFLAGDVELTARWPDGSIIESHRFHTDNRNIYFNLGSHCLAVMDASGLYTEGADASRIQVIERLTRDDRIYLIPDGLVVRPRGTVPEQIPQGRRVIWIEDVACELLVESEEHLLIGQQVVRMEGRREARREALREAQQGRE